MFGQKHGISDSNEIVLSQFRDNYNYCFFLRCLVNWESHFKFNNYLYSDKKNIYI